MVARFWLVKRTETEVRNGKKMRDSTICTNFSEVGEARHYCFLLSACMWKAGSRVPFIFCSSLDLSWLPSAHHTKWGHPQGFGEKRQQAAQASAGLPEVGGCRASRGEGTHGGAANHGWPSVSQSTVDFKPEFVSRFPLCPGMTILHLPDSFTLALYRSGLLSFSKFFFFRIIMERFCNTQISLQGQGLFICRRFNELNISSSLLLFTCT